MSSVQVINDINKTLHRVLRESFGEDDRDAQIIFGAPSDESSIGGDNTTAGLYVFLYNITEDPFYRNLPNEVRGGEHILSMKPPLGINLYYMLTPFSPTIGGRESLEDIRAHTLIVKAMRALHENGIVNPKYFPHNTVLGRSRVKISPSQINLEELTKIWGSFNKPFKLSICYEISIAWVFPLEPAKELFLVEKPVLEGAPTVGKKKLSLLKARGGDIVRVHSDRIQESADVRPTSVQPGMSISVYGINSRGKKLKVSIDNRELEEKFYRIIDENLIKIKIPTDEKPGIKELSLKSDDQDLNVLIIVEVLASKLPDIQITEIRPESGKSNDLITIYGINFTDDLKVKIGDKEASTLTFVDRAQINVMIPRNLPAGTTTITVRNDTGIASKQFMIQ